MRADRLISILMHLQNRRMTAKELSQLLEVSERTIYRDIDALCSSGVPIQADSGLGGGFSLPPDYRTKVDGLNTSEIHALFLQMNEEPFKSLGISQSMKSAWLKLFNSLSAPLQVDVEWIRNRVFLDMGGWRKRQENEGWLKRVQQSVWEQRKAFAMYKDRFHARHELELEPYALVMKTGTWFVVGRSGEEIRSFLITRFESFELTDQRFERMEGFDLETYWHQWITDYGRKQSQYRVILEGDARALSQIAKMGGVVLESGTSKEPGQEGWLEAQVSFENIESALSALLAQGRQVHILAPQELRERIRELVVSLAALYRD